MKKIEMTVNPETLNLVKNALKAIGVSGMTITEARVFEDQGGHREIFRGVEYRVDYVPKAKIEMVVEEKNLDRVIHTITNVCQGNEDVGGGEIFISSIDEVIRIRTKEKGRSAI